MTTLQQRAQVSTNMTPDSVCRVNMPAVTFAALWAGYPANPPYRDHKTGKPPAGFENQCAIKISVAIHSAGIEMKSFTAKSIGVRPSDLGHININGRTAATRASQLAAWLDKQPFCGLPRKPEIITGEDWQSKIARRTGIVYFADYWMRKTDARNQSTGDHIDLWNGSRLTASGLIGTLTTTARYLGQRSFLPGTDWGYSDLGKSKTILFWEIK
ncbi:T6SS effector amidase Tae4 family protein [Rubrivivax gelatinosus]